MATLCDHDFPPVTAENLIFMRRLLALMESKYIQQNENVGHENYNLDVQIPLFPSSNILMNEKELAIIKYRWCRKPKEMVRQLLKNIVGENELKEMSAKGRGNRKPVPKNIFYDVAFFVNENVEECYQLNMYEYTRCVTQMCNTLRTPRKSFTSRRQIFTNGRKVNPESNEVQQSIMKKKSVQDDSIQESDDDSSIHENEEEPQFKKENPSENENEAQSKKENSSEIESENENDDTTEENACSEFRKDRLSIQNLKRKHDNECHDRCIKKYC